MCSFEPAQAQFFNMAMPFHNMQSYAELYGCSDYDVFGGQYEEIMHEFRSDSSIIPTALSEKVLNTSDKIPHAYITAYKDDDNQYRTTIIHKPRYYHHAMGMEDTPWDNKSWAFLGDVINNQIATVRWPETAFRLTSPVNVTTMQQFQQNMGAGVQFQSEEEEETAQFEEANEEEKDGHEVAPATVESIKTRYMMYVPPKYVPLLLGRHLTPMETWECVGNAIIRDGNGQACEPLLNWLRVSGAPTVRGDIATCLPRPRIPFPDERLTAHRWKLVCNDLPALAITAGIATATEPAQGEHAQQMERLLGELIRQNSQRERTARQPKLPSTRWPAIYDNMM
ncbi:MAG: hypothetical protein ACREOZ_01680, partial [Gloeomargaritales cyanobacterium]